jgi:hypothetical protein
MVWGRVRAENRLWMAMTHMEAMVTYVWEIRFSFRVRGVSIGW